MPPVFKEILVCVAGATPQVITETIFALSQKSPPVNIDEIFIITTKKGKEKITEDLIKKGILNSLIEEYNLPHFKFSEKSIITLTIDGMEIDDIRNSTESEIAADTIVQFIYELTKDHTSRLHCSIAGGRKTMSFYLGAALQLFGRPQDRLYHVLVSPEFEANPEFFYPPKIPRQIVCRLEDGSIRMISTDRARIELAEIPFLRLRDKIDLKYSSFREIIATSQSEIDIAVMQPEIKIKLKERKIRLGNNILTFSPLLSAIYTFFLKRKIDCNLSHACFSCNDCYVNINKMTEKPYIDEIASIYGYLYDEDPVKTEDFKRNYTQKYADENFRSYISKINREIVHAIKDESVAQYCLIKSIRKYGSTLYGVSVDKRKIKII